MEDPVNIAVNMDLNGKTWDNQGTVMHDSFTLQNTVNTACFFDFRQIPGGFSTVNETGTILQGNIAKESLRPNA